MQIKKERLRMVVFGISIQRQGPTTAESTGTRGTAQDHK